MVQVHFEIVLNANVECESVGVNHLLETVKPPAVLL